MSDRLNGLQNVSASGKQRLAEDERYRCKGNKLIMATSKISASINSRLQRNSGKYKLIERIYNLQNRDFFLKIPI